MVIALGIFSFSVVNLPRARTFRAAHEPQESCAGRLPQGPVLSPRLRTGFEPGHPLGAPDV
ncbi:MAG: hypothetical protein ACOX4B_00070 [Bacillota bacterium]